MGKVLHLRRPGFGRWSPNTSASLQDSGIGSSGSSSMLSSEPGTTPVGGSPTSSPASSVQSKWQGPRQRPSALKTLLCMFLPLLLLAATATSIWQRHSRRSSIADALLAAAQGRPAAAAAGARQLGEAGASITAGRACAEALQIPQVAMLFLVKGPLRHEAVWAAWFERAAGLLPAQAVSNSLCATGRFSPDVLAACGSLTGQVNTVAAVDAPGAPPAQLPWRRHSPRQQQQQPADSWAPGSSASGRLRSLISGRGSSGTSSSGGGGGKASRWLSEGWASQLPPPGVLDRQHLFDVYVHPHPSFTGYAPGSLLYDRELPTSQRVATEWGSHSLVDAAEALLQAALRNPRNQKFFILSESDLPLYSPQALYLQLMGEHRSRLNACNTTRGWDLDYYRWVDRMRTPFLSRSLWRKSSQWFVLNRKHVELVLADWRVESVFQRHCRTTWEEERGEERVCYPDEHYIPTLMAVHGLDAETDCQGRFMDVDWSRVSKTSPHPWQYRPGEVTDQLFQALRRPSRPGCLSAAAALAAAPAAFIPQQQLFSAAVSAGAPAGEAPGSEALGREVCRQLLHHQQEQPGFPAVGPDCPLMARKFTDETVKAALMALAPCDSTTLILHDGWCPGESGQARAARQLWWQLAPWLLLASFISVSATLLHHFVPLQTIPDLLRRMYPRCNAKLASPLLIV